MLHVHVNDDLTSWMLYIDDIKWDFFFSVSWLCHTLWCGAYSTAVLVASFISFRRRRTFPPFLASSHAEAEQDIIQFQSAGHPMAPTPSPSPSPMSFIVTKTWAGGVTEEATPIW